MSKLNTVDRISALCTYQKSAIRPAVDILCSFAKIKRSKTILISRQPIANLIRSNKVYTSVQQGDMGAIPRYKIKGV